MAYTPLEQNMEWPTVQSVINTNFAAIDVSTALRLTYTGTVPAIGDVLVAASIDGLTVKRQVLTDSQTVETDWSGHLTTAAKGTWYNLNLGTTSNTVLEGSNDALYMKLAGTQTVTGNKTFSGTIVLPSTTTGVTQSLWDNSTKLATTAYADTAVVICKKWQGTRTAGAGAGTVTIAHGCGRTPKLVIFYFTATSTSNAATTSGVGTCSTASDESCSYSVASTTWVSSGQAASSIMYSEMSTGTQQWAVTVTGLDATNITLSFATPWAAPWTMNYDWAATA